MTSGSYLGNGTSQAITGLGFQPSIVIVKGDSAVNSEAVMRTTTMTTGSKGLTLGQVLLANCIQSLDAAGFTVGSASHVNTLGITYYWIAFKAVPGELKVGTYSGTNVDNRSITGVGFRPAYVIVLGENAADPVQRSSAMSGDLSVSFDAGTSADQIQALQPDGFELGQQNEVNANGTPYHYAAWKAIPGRMAVGTYTGNSSDDRSISGVGFRPEYVIAKANFGGGGSAVHKSTTTGPTAAHSLGMTPTLANGLDQMQAFEADGFQVGLDSRTNRPGAPNTYYWAAFADDTATHVYYSVGTSRATSTRTSCPARPRSRSPRASPRLASRSRTTSAWATRFSTAASPATSPVVSARPSTG